ncbi:MAG: hypothetical protein JNM57_06190 [Cyclobacteriaceae bacterium]|nr:hypothetical protein [Cyclobacteriaceae bacterium]
MIISVAKADNEGNPTYFTKNATIAVDKVSLNCYSVDAFRNRLFQLIRNRAPFRVGEDIVLTPNLTAKEKGYRYIVDVKYRNKSIVQLAFDPTMSAMQSDQIKVKVYNRCLYENGWTGIVDHLLKSLNLQLRSITELHIAMDADGIVEDFLNLYHIPSLDLVRDGVGGTHRRKQLSVKKGFHYNSKSSDVYFTFYDKSKEYIEKPYLKQFHEANGLGDQVQRIELRVKSISKQSYSGVTLSQLGEINVLLKLFEYEFQKRIVFKNTDASKMLYDNNRNKKCPKIQMVKLPNGECEIVLLEKSGNQIDNLKSKKSTAKNLFLYVLENPQHREIYTLRGFLITNNLLDWFNGKSASWGISDPDKARMIMMVLNNPLPDEKRNWFDRIKQTMLSKIVMSVPNIRIEALPDVVPMQLAA